VQVVGSNIAEVSGGSHQQQHQQQQQQLSQHESWLCSTAVLLI
jgi:hypothetical protein